MKSLIIPLFVLLTLALIGALLVHERQSLIFEDKIGELTRELFKRDYQIRVQAKKITALEESEKVITAEAEALRKRLHAVANAPAERTDASVSPNPTEPTPGSSIIVNQMMNTPEMKKLEAGLSNPARPSSPATPNVPKNPDDASKSTPTQLPP